jgi:REP element-mobilizing transposase RayT
MVAANVRTNHVHVIVVAPLLPPHVAMNGFKSHATRALKEAGLVRDGQRPWSRHGSTRFLWTEEDVGVAYQYVVEQQGDDIGGVITFDGFESTGSQP